MPVNALTANLDLNLGNKLLTREIEPPSIDRAISTGGEFLTNLGECDLKKSGVGKITITGNGACYTSAEIGLAVKCLLNCLHGKVSVPAVGYFPKGNLRVTS
jgi:hypothetical protein